MTRPTRRGPAHLSPAARKLYLSVVEAFEMEAHDEAVLVKALEAWDRAEQCRAAIDRDGLVVTSRLGERKAHPLLSTERESRAAFLAGMKALHLDYEPVSDQSRTKAARAARWP